MQAQTPKIRIQYNGKNITEDISKYLLSFRYSDKLEGESDEIELQLEDSAGLWRGDWIPAVGDKIEAWIGYDGDAEVSCGAFEVDEISLRFPPDVVSIKALAAGVNSPIRTRKSSAHENKSLKQIAEAIATNNGYTVQGEIASYQIGRVTQNRETDLEFLKRLSDQFGYVFALRDKTLVFTSIFDLEKGKPVVEIPRNEMIDGDIKISAVKTYKKATVSYREPNSDEVIKYDAENDLAYYAPAGDTLEIKERAENKQQAEAMAKSKLHRANTAGTVGSIRVIGNPVLVAGNSINLVEMGRFSGKWHILASTHSISRTGGYTTDLEIKKTAE